MGAGKTTIGRRLAKRLNLPFSDSDQAVEEMVGCSVAQIFDIQGEAYFRKKECEAIKDILSESPQVLATGGGAFIEANTRALIQKKGLSIWLKAELDVLVERVSRRNHRPLLHSKDKRSVLQELMDKRYPVYAGAHITVDSGGNSHSKVVDQIIREIERI